jgi:FkbM family methyltransferase
MSLYFLRNRVKQILRMCGHAFVSTVHDRLNVMDQQINGIIEQNASLARTQTALLQSCIHVVETLQGVQTDSSHHGADLRRLIESLRELETDTAETQRAFLQSCIQRLDAVRDDQVATREQADATQRQIGEVIEMLVKSEESHTAMLQSSVHIIEKLAEAQAHWDNETDALKRVDRTVHQVVGAQQSHRALLQSCVDAVNGIKQEQQEMLRSSVTDLVDLKQAQAAIGQQGGEFRERLERALQQETEGREKQSELIRVLLSKHDDAIGGTRELLEQITQLQRYTQDVFEQQLVRQVCAETDDYGFVNPEIGLMASLYSYLPTHKAMDIGAHLGDVSEHLLKSGYEVYAFEPCPSSYKALVKRLGRSKGFHHFKFALGRVEAELPLHIATDRSSSGLYHDASAFNSLTPHSMPDDLPFTKTILVPVKTLAALHRDILPKDVSLVKIDTEGYDLEVVRGMGAHRYPVVAVEFWDTRIPFGKSGLLYTMESMVGQMRKRGYLWHIVLYRIWGRNQTAYYCNHERPVPESWGNIFFFRDYETFAHAQTWCSAVLPRTHFKPVPAK